MLFTFADGNTGRVNFPEALGKSGKFSPDFQQAIQDSRQRVVDALTSQPSTQSLLDAIEAYLPYLLAVIGVAERDRLVEIEYAWRSVLTAGIISGLGKHKTSEKKIHRCASIYYEAIYMMISYALALANMAAKRVGDGSVGETVLNEAIDMYCRAAGVLSLIGTTWATRWSGPSTKTRPPETTPSGLSALTDFMLLQAQLLAISKAEKRSISVPTLAKLHRDALERFATVRGHLRATGGDWSDVFVDYVREGHLVQEAVLMKRYAAYCHAGDKNGMAVACMTKSYNLFIDLRSVKTPCWAKVCAEQKDEMKQLLDQYTRINNHVTYEPIPTGDDMIAALPASTSLVSKKPYSLPDPIKICQEVELVSTAIEPLPIEEMKKAVSTDGEAKDVPTPKDGNNFRSFFKMDPKDMKY